MKKQTRLILFMFVVMLLLAVTAIGASAAYKADGTSYNTLQEAVENVSDGGTITVTADATLTGDVVLDYDKTYTIDAFYTTSWLGKTEGVRTLTINSGGLVIKAGNVTLQNITVVSNTTNALRVTRTSTGKVQAGVGTTVTVKNGTTVKSLGTTNETGMAVLVDSYATLLVEGGSFYGAVGVHKNSTNGAWVTITGGDFYPNTKMADAKKSTRLLTANRVGVTLNVEGGTFHLSDATTSGSVVLYISSAAANVTISDGTFIASKTIEKQALIQVKLGNLTISGGRFEVPAPTGYALNIEDTANVEIKGGTFDIAGSGYAMAVLAGASVNISGGTFNIEDSGYAMAVLAGASVNISGGEFRGVSEKEGAALIWAFAGRFTISGGTFTTKGSVLFDLALRKSQGDTFTVTGGSFILEESSVIKSGAHIRTRVGVNLDELALDNYSDPTNTYYLSDVDISLEGGVFIDCRKSTSPLIDVSLGSSAVTVTGAVLLSTYVKNYLVDVNNEIGTDITFANNTAKVKYNEAEYYCYRTYSTTATLHTYDPIMEDGAYVALTKEYRGIRFSSYIPASIVQKLEGKTYTIGTLIAPADHVAAAGGFTHEMMNTWAQSAGVDLPYVDIVAKDSIQNRSDGSISFNGALVELQSYTRAYAAVSYVKMGDTYYYSTYSVENNARTMAYVAKMAYTEVAESGYESLYMPGAYSEYTKDEQQLLQEMSGYTHTRTTAIVTPSTHIEYGTAGNNLQNKGAKLSDALRSRGYGTTGTPIFVSSKGSTDDRVTKALAEVEGYGYYIGVIDGTIVIAGSNDALTMQAIDVFNGLCSGGAIQLTEYVCSNVEMTALTAETPFVYPHTRDNRVYNIHLHGTDYYSALGENYAEQNFNSIFTHLYNKETNNNSVGLDYPLLAALEIGGALADGDFDAGFTFTYVPDNFTVSGAAIYIGNTARARATFLAGKDVGYYGYAVRGGNVYVGSYDDATLRLARSMFVNDLGDFALDTNGDGVADIYAIPAGYTFERGSSNGFTGDFDSVENAADATNKDVTNELASLITDYPRPNGLSLSGAVSVSNGELELYYLGASVRNYKSYLVQLYENGYRPYMAEREVDGSYFVTYVNDDEGIMLHIIYNGYRWASVQPMDDETSDNTLDAMVTPTLRVISAKTEADYGYVHHLLPKELLTKQEYKKITNSRLTVVQLDPRKANGEDTSFGYCYVYTLEDGSFVVLDGGNGYKADVTNFYNVLWELHTEAHDSTPSASNPIRIAAWYISHGHGDHVGLLNQFSSSYISNSSKYVRLESIIGNFPSNDEIYNAHSINQGVLNRMGTDAWYKNADGTAVKFYNVHTGQVFFIGNLEFEVMFTTEDMHPWSMLVFNNACTVMRLTVNSHNVANGGTVAAGATPSSRVSNMVLGDIMARSSRVMRATFGPSLASDMVVIAHHSTGAEGELYELISAKVVFWTCRAETVQGGTVTGENMQLINNTRWLYMFTGRALKSYTDNGGYVFNPTITFTASGVAGLVEGDDGYDVEENTRAFLEGLENVAGGYYDFSADYSYDKFTGGAYEGNGAVLWRGNYFDDVTLPDHIDWGTLPELPPEPDAPQGGVDSAFDIFGEEILPEID